MATPYKPVLLGFALVFAALCSLGAASAALTDGVYDNWNLSALRGIRNQYNLTLFSGSCTLQSGKGLIGDAYLCGGTPSLRATIPNIGTTTYTIAFWTNFTSFSGGNQIYWRDGAGFGADLILINANGSMSIYTGTGSANTIATTNGSFTTNQWTFVVATWSRVNNSIYINLNNGRAVGSKATTWGGTRQTSIYLGAANGAAGPSSFLDEYTVYNRTLSAAEIDSLYNAGGGLAYPFSTGSSSVCSCSGSAVCYINNGACNITSNINVGGYPIVFNGTGSTVIEANVTNCNATIRTGTVWLKAGRLC